VERIWVWRARKIEIEIETSNNTASTITTKLFFFGSIGETGGVVDCGGVGTIGICGSIL